MPRCCKWETGRAQTSLWKHMRFRIPSLAPEPERPSIRYWRHFMKKIDKLTKEEIEQAFEESKS
nr:MAG TPA: hypothetical protein [Caudoviricetes sp.]